MDNYQFIYIFYQVTSFGTNRFLIDTIFISSFEKSLNLFLPERHHRNYAKGPKKTLRQDLIHQYVGELQTVCASGASRPTISDNSLNANKI
jgi:hypothetical protein